VGGDWSEVVAGECSPSHPSVFGGRDQIKREIAPEEMVFTSGISVFGQEGRGRTA
jgi:hypothetical protein